MNHWILVRHGESQANADGRLAGHLDVGLTERGREQARQAGRALAGERFALAITSDLRRASDTARLLLDQWSEARGEPPPALRTVPDLRERSVGEWADLLRADLRAEGKMPYLTSWSLAPPGGESQGQLARRVLPALAEIEAGMSGQEGSILVVAHGGVMRVVLGLLEGRDREDIGFFGVNNAEPSHLHLSASRFSDLTRALLTETM